MERQHLPALQFGMTINAAADSIPQDIALARQAERIGFDFLSVSDHPYNPGMVDSWTWLTVLGTKTERVRLLTDVLNLPLRPPAMLAKASATLDLVTGGRVEIGLGAGVQKQGIAAYGGTVLAPADSVRAYEEAIQMMRAFWQAATSGSHVSFAGAFYQLNDAQPGPATAHRIPLWFGAYRPRMVHLTGRLADGWIGSTFSMLPEHVPALQQAIDEGAGEAGREFTAIRRGYNVPGVILPRGSSVITPKQRGFFAGPVNAWVQELVHYVTDLRMDTINFSPMREAEYQACAFMEEIVPAVRGALK